MAQVRHTAGCLCGRSDSRRSARANVEWCSAISLVAAATARSLPPSPSSDRRSRGHRRDQISSATGISVPSADRSVFGRAAEKSVASWVPSAAESDDADLRDLVPALQRPARRPFECHRAGRPSRMRNRWASHEGLSLDACFGGLGRSPGAGASAPQAAPPPRLRRLSAAGRGAAAAGARGWSFSRSRPAARRCACAPRRGSRTSCRSAPASPRRRPASRPP